MGLDIVYHVGEPKLVAESQEDVTEAWQDANWYRSTIVRNDEPFAGREAPLKAGAVYEWDGESFSFRAGSYSGYNEFRKRLCLLAYGKTDEEVWASVTEGPFFEQIWFTDCDGTIGQVVAKKLAKDYADYEERAREAFDEWTLRTYLQFKVAFTAVAEGGGAVRFA